MVVDKTLDKYLADIILTMTCNGFEYNSEIKRYQLRISHITESIFNNMADRASAIGKKLTVEMVLMKMTESEFLVLRTDLRILKEQQVMQIYANDNIGKGESIYISSYGNVKVLQSWILMPLEYHYYADWHYA